MTSVFNSCRACPFFVQLNDGRRQYSHIVETPSHNERCLRLRNFTLGVSFFADSSGTHQWWPGRSRHQEPGRVRVCAVFLQKKVSPHRFLLFHEWVLRAERDETRDASLFEFGLALVGPSLGAKKRQQKNLIRLIWAVSQGRGGFARRPRRARSNRKRSPR